MHMSSECYTSSTTPQGSLVLFLLVCLLLTLHSIDDMVIDVDGGVRSLNILLVEAESHSAKPPFQAYSLILHTSEYRQCEKSWRQASGLWKDNPRVSWFQGI